MSNPAPRPPRGHGPMAGMRGGGPKAKNAKGSLLRLLRYLSRFKLSLILVIFFAIASTVFNIVSPKILGMATTRLAEGVYGIVMNTGSGIDFEYIGVIMVVLICLYLCSMGFSYLQGHLMSRVSMMTTYSLRKDISEKLHKLPFQYYDSTTTGEILSYITNDVDAINQSLNQSVTQIITSVTTLLGILVMMFSIHWLLALVTLCIIPVSMLLIMVIAKTSQKHFKAQQEYLGHVNGHIEEMYSSHVVVKAYNGEAQSEKTFTGYNDKLYQSAWKSQFLSGLMMPMMNFVGNLGYVAVCILGGYLAISGSISIGDIQAFLQYVRQFNQPISQVAQISNIIQQTAAAAERVFAFLDEQEEVPDTATPIRLTHSDPQNGITLSGSVQFDHVRFGYDPEKIIIKDFCADVKPGQKIAIVGPTGAGKTTMIKLLMRFYDVTSGAIRLDGHDIRDFTRDDLRSVFGMVLQDTWLYNASIKENIRYGKRDATDEMIYAAAKAAQVDHFVHTLPHGYDMELNEDASNVSQGQKQLLTIARAILADPQILILDEATSSVDTRTEILIQKAMDNLMQGRTSFVIAHRLSTVRNADLILVMRDGDIIEQGSHEDLMAQNGFYANLYNSQFEPDE
ncbi:MAG: ABC transporter ATP-binding protein [Oscillospiraceae bacterium]|nr:ABC transporter ATP-binding protein [Oscillospiraceae bacterium]